MNQYYVYMLTNRWKNVLYTGVTNDLERRCYQHRHHLLPGFTKKYNVDRLVYVERFNDVRLAIAREKEIKKWSRTKKNRLVATTNPAWEDLAKSIGRGQEGDPSLRSG